MSDNGNCRITIVGGGILGLTTACTILKQYASVKHLQLTIIADNFSPNTTGDVSAGFWLPYGLDLADSRLLSWAQYSYEIFMAEYFSSKAARAGVIQLPGYIIKDQDVEQTGTGDCLANYPFLSAVQHYRMLDETERRMFSHLGAISGFVMSTVVVEVRRYLPELRRYLERDSRVTFVQRKVASLDELKGQADVVINCSGLGARQLVGDEAARPARGQVIRVHAPWIKCMYYLDSKSTGTSYIIPQSETVVLGGTYQLDDWSTTPTDVDNDHIRSSCARILPALADVHGGDEQAGLRPYRDGGVRLEQESTSDGVRVVHCYGHSGSGVTLSWGCARDVVRIVQSLLPVDEPSASELPLHEQLWRLTY